MSDGTLAHQGVKGMHWGVRKNTPTNANYTTSQRGTDKRDLGKGSAKRINRRMNSGQDHSQAVKNEKKFIVKRAVVVTGAYYGLRALNQYGPSISGSIAQKAQTKRGQAAAASALGLPRTASEGPSFAKQKRGAYKISSI